MQLQFHVEAPPGALRSTDRNRRAMIQAAGMKNFDDVEEGDVVQVGDVVAKIDLEQRGTFEFDDIRVQIESFQERWKIERISPFG